MSNKNFIQEFNTHLKPLNDSLFDKNVEEQLPNIYVIGLPRSGTTLLTQVLFNCLDIGCTSNFISKFWDVPLVGFQLSNEIIGDFKPNNYTSLYGKSEDLYSPHEFSFFWHNVLNINPNKIEKINYQTISKNVDWDILKGVICNINEIAKKPIIYKPLELIGSILSDFQRNLNKSLFIYVERNKEEVALSLAKGRMDYYGDINCWFSSLPPNHEGILNLPYNEQITQQVNGLTDMYESNIKKIPEENILKLTYDELCDFPESIVERTKNKLNNLSKFNVNKVNNVEFTFKKSMPKLENKAIENNIINSLKISK